MTGRWGKVLLDPLNSIHDHDAGKLGHARLAHQRLRHRGQRRLAHPFPQGRDTAQRHDAEEHARSDGRHRPRAVGRARRNSTRCLTKPIRSRRTVPGAVRPSCPISLTFRTISPSSLCFSAAGLCQRRFMFDAEGNLWSGQNWMPGSQSGVNKSIGGGVVKFSSQRNPHSRRRSPASPAWALTASAGAPP